MDILSIAILVFIILEALNVIILYFKPDSTLGNGVAVFTGWEKSKEHPELHEFVRYLVFWVAGTKLIFIMLLVVILLFGSPTLKLFSVIALIFSILTFYWRLYPIIRSLDQKGHIAPKGYSKSLAWMIAGFVLVFTLAFILNLIV